MTPSTIFRLAFIAAALLIVAFTGRRHWPGVYHLALLSVCMLTIAALDTPK